MKIAVTHTTTYAYSMPVSLGQHVIRMRPRCDGALRLLAFDLEIEPTPVLRTDCLDAEGNSVVHAWFAGTTERLAVRTKFEVETLRANPFDYLLEPLAQGLPFAYPPALDGSLACYCSRSENNDTILKFACEIAKAAGWRTTEFLNGLNTTIYGMCEKVIRETGAPQLPEMTLRERSGSCRDLAVLFIESCRNLGIAARFVSGYQNSGPDSGARHMHAWPEVFLPGGGWRGYDPAKGLAVDESHVAVAASREPASATPISGTFGGGGASSTMDVDLHIR